MFTATTFSNKLAVKGLLLSIGLLGVCAFNSAALADESAPAVHAKKVVLSDLDLSTPAGQRVALERVHQAARTLCGQVADHLDLAHQPHFVACVDAAMSRATDNLQAMANHNSQKMLAQVSETQR